MRVEDCYLLGNIIKPHGLQGEVQVFLDVDSPETYENLESVFVLVNNKLVPFFISSISIHSSKTIIHFEDMDSREDAEAVSGKEIYLPLDFLPQLPNDQFYFHEIIGFDLIENDKVLGKVENVFNFSSQNLISTLIDDKEVLIPIQDEIIEQVDKDQKVVRVSLPDGLLDVYLKNDKDED